MTDMHAHITPEGWPAAFNDVLRTHLPPATQAVKLSADDTLFGLGLDSFGTVELLVAIEAEFAVSFPDEALTAETFATVGSLWSTLSRLLDDSAADASVGGTP